MDEPKPIYIEVLRNSNAMKSFQMYCEGIDVVCFYESVQNSTGRVLPRLTCPSLFPFSGEFLECQEGFLLTFFY